MPPIWLIVLAAMLPQYDEVREDVLFLRQGWRRILIPYTSLIGIQARSDSMSVPVFSTDRLLIVIRGGKRFLIAVAERERFLAEVSQPCPQLERRTQGLVIPLPPSLG
jgi:hypothetical protein